MVGIPSEYTRWVWFVIDSFSWHKDSNDGPGWWYVGKLRGGDGYIEVFVEDTSIEILYRCWNEKTERNEYWAWKVHSSEVNLIPWLVLMVNAAS